MHALTHMINYYNNAVNEDIYFSVARSLLENLDQLPGGNIYDWAQICCVSPSTISRFCQKLGYKSFQEFKLELSNAIRNYNMLNRYVSINQISTYGSEESAYLSALSAIVDDFVKKIDQNKLNEMADIIYSHKNIRIYTNGIYMHETNLQTNLLLSGHTARIIASPVMQIKDASSICEDTAVILTLPNVHENTVRLELLQILQQKKACILLLTNSTCSVYLKYAFCAFCFDGSMTQIDDFYFTIFLSMLSITYRNKYLN